jgi:hypothetical protein
MTDNFTGGIKSMRQDFVGDESSQVEEEKFADSFNLHRGKGCGER